MILISSPISPEKDSIDGRINNNITNINSMFVDIIPKIVQAIIALILLILTIVNWKMNHLGANIINF